MIVLNEEAQVIWLVFMQALRLKHKFDIPQRTCQLTLGTWLRFWLEQSATNLPPRQEQVQLGKQLWLGASSRLTASEFSQLSKSNQVNRVQLLARWAPIAVRLRRANFDGCHYGLAEITWNEDDHASLPGAASPD